MELFQTDPLKKTNLLISINEFELMLFPFALTSPQIWCNTLENSNVDMIAN